ncbi:MAG: hypothetical protein HC824_06930 [Synechococcales cyanobacterium RM1_1_8]|nr:hypothetical protein [Synechococcales cyanobacterium RM1_1_8]
MSFNLDSLDKLEFDQADDQLNDYIDELIDLFSQSPEGQTYQQQYPNSGGWVSTFLDLGYRYEGVTPTMITQREVGVLMEEVLPRKITLRSAEEAEDAVPELIAFWSYLEREYQLSHAGAILKYLREIAGQFGGWMMDPQRAGMAKSFMMGGMQAGFDMSSQQGLNEFQAVYNAQLLGASPSPSPKRQSSKQTTKANLKGFGHVARAKSSRRKKPN